MSSKLLEHVPDKGDEIYCAMKEFPFDTSKHLPGLIAAETQLPRHFTQLDWAWESVRKGRRALGSPNKNHQIIILGSEKQESTLADTFTALSSRSCQ